MILLLENIIRAGLSSVMGDRHAKSNENEKILYKAANNLHGWAMSDYLPYDEVKFDRDVKLAGIINTPDDSDFGYFIEIDLKYLDNIKEKTKNFLFALQNKIIHKEKYNDYIKNIKLRNFTKAKKINM